MKILMPVEDRVFGEALVDFVAGHSWPADTEIRIIHVIEPLYIEAYGLSAELEQERMDHGRDLVRDLTIRLSQSFPEAQIEKLVFHGEPRSEILSMAKEWKCDYIVMGSHGRKGISKFLMGSVSSAVLQHAPCTVMLVKPPLLEIRRPPHEYEQDTVNGEAEKTTAGTR